MRQTQTNYFICYAFFLFCIAALGMAAPCGQAMAAVKPSAQKPGVIDSYAERIKSKVLRNLRVPQTADSNTYVTTTRVDLDPNGNVLRVFITNPSGNRAFDSAVVQAIRKTVSFGQPPFQELRAVGLRFSSRF